MAYRSSDLRGPCHCRLPVAGVARDRHWPPIGSRSWQLSLGLASRILYGGEFVCNVCIVCKIKVECTNMHFLQNERTRTPCKAIITIHKNLGTILHGMLVQFKDS